MLKVAFLIATVSLSQSGMANVIGSDFQNFNPTTNGLDFVTVQSGQTLRPGILNTGVFFNYATNTLPEFKDGKPAEFSRGEVRNSALFSDLNLGLGITKGWDIGLSFPMILTQNVKEEGQSRLEYDVQGLNEIRLNTKVRLLGEVDHALALVFTVNQNLLEDNPYAGIDAGPIINLELAAHTSFGNIRSGLNVGYRKKSPGAEIEEVPVDPFNDQWNGSVALSYLFAAIDTKLIFEFFGSGAVDPGKTESEAFQKSGEALLGAKHDVTTELALHVGASTGVIASPVAPDYRIYAGLNYNAGPFYAKDPPRKKRPRRLAVQPTEDTEELLPLPESVVEETEQPIATFVFENIKFVFDSSKQVLGGSRSELQELADYLASLPSWRLMVVEGHTDSVGDDDYNQVLSLRRASAVRNHLINNFKLPGDKIRVNGYGESRPVADNDNYQGRQLNRRVEVKIYIGDEEVPQT